MEVAGFSSSLSYAKVRDFAYHDRHPLHYGTLANGEGQSEPNSGGSADECEDSTPGRREGEGSSASRLQVHEAEPVGRSNLNDIYRRAVALFDFEPENSNEARLVEGQIVWISYRHGQGWLVSENLETGETGLVPEEYVQVLPENNEEWVDTN